MRKKKENITSTLINVLCLKWKIENSFLTLLYFIYLSLFSYTYFILWHMMVALVVVVVELLLFHQIHFVFVFFYIRLYTWFNAINLLVNKFGWIILDWLEWAQISFANSKDFVMIIIRYYEGCIFMYTWILTFTCKFLSWLIFKLVFKGFWKKSA